MSELKLCKDCKWCRRDWVERLVGSWQFSKCLQRKFVSVDPVSGVAGGVLGFCSTSRNYGPCFKEGKYWEGKDVS